MVDHYEYENFQKRQRLKDYNLFELNKISFRLFGVVRESKADNNIFSCIYK